MSLSTEIANDMAGVEILKDWLGDGGIPVPVEQAEARAQICVGCPQNVQPGWWERNLKLRVAQVIRHQLELKADMSLMVPGEEALGMCRVCGCCNSLAVHVPVVHLKNHTSKRVLEAFPDTCWKKKEIGEL